MNDPSVAAALWTLSSLLVELVAGSVNNDTLHASNGPQDSDNDSTENTEP